MPLEYQAAVLHEPGTPLRIETLVATDLQPTDVLVRIRAAGLCHTDLEVIQGQLRYPMPIVLGHEAAGMVEKVGSEVAGCQAGRPRRPVLESALRALLLLRPRPADPVRAHTSARAPRRCSSMARRGPAFEMAATCTT